MDVHKIFIFDPRLQKVPVFSLNFKMYLNADVTSFLHIESLKEKIKQNVYPRLFIVHHSICVEDVINLFQANEDISIISLGVPKSTFENVEIVDEHITIPDLLKNLSTKLNITAEQMVKIKHADYMPIPHRFLSRLIFSPCDIYIKKEARYELTVEAGKSISEDFLDELNENSEVYIDSIKRLSFTDSFTDQFSKMSNLLTDFATDIDQKTENLEKVMSFVARDFKNGGMQPESIEIAESCINAIIDTPMDSPLLHKLKENMISRSVTVRSVNSFAIAFIGKHIIDSLDWILENGQQDIATAAFFHDLILDEDDQLKVGTEDELNKLGLNPEKEQIIREHPRLIWSVLRGVKSISEQAKTLVKEQHGSTTGVGFLTDLDDLKPLSKIFIVSNYWAYMVYGASSGQLSNEEIGDRLKELFPGQDYLEIINSILILNIKSVDDLMAYLTQIEKEDEYVETSLGQDLANIDEIIRVNGHKIDDLTRENLRAIGFFGEKANHIKVNGSKNLNENDEAVIKEITDAINEVNQLVKGKPELQDNEKNTISGFNENADDATHVKGIDEKENKTKYTVKGGSADVSEETQLVKGLRDEQKEDTLKIKGGANEKEEIQIIRGEFDEKVNKLKLVIADNENKLDEIKKRSLDIKKASFTDLMLAAMKGSLELTKYYLEKDKSTLNRTDGEGRSAIHFAAIGGNIEVVEFLLENGAKINHLDGKRRNPIFFTIVKGHSKCFDYFLDKDARVTQQSVGGVNLAMTAAKYGRPLMLHRILGKGVSISSKDTNGKGVRDYAKKNKEILNIIEKFEN